VSASAAVRRSAYAENLHAEMQYQLAVTAILLVTTRPADRDPRAPMFTQSELDEMDLARTMGLSAAGFAARLMARDKAGAL
jgi:hypothetical protein